MNLFLLGGAPGSGKSTAASAIIASLCPEDTVMVASDDWFDTVLGGVFDPSRLTDAHNWCQSIVREAMVENMSTIVVHNTFTNLGENGARPYLDMAEAFGYRCHLLYAVNHHGSSSVHNVPGHTVTRMAEECSNTLLESTTKMLEGRNETI